MTDEQFDEFVDTCYEEFEIKQNKVHEEYKIGSIGEYWFDQVSKVLQFRNNNIVELEFDIVCIGSWAHKKETWMWSWANASMTDECRKDSELLKGLKVRTGYDIFEMEGLKCNELLAYELVAMSIKQLNAIGMYRIPGETSHLFVALIRKRESC